MRSIQRWWSDGGWLMLVMCGAFAFAGWGISLWLRRTIIAIETAATPQMAMARATEVILFVLFLLIGFVIGMRKK